MIQLKKSSRMDSASLTLMGKTRLERPLFFQQTRWCWNMVTKVTVVLCGSKLKPVEKRFFWGRCMPQTIGDRDVTSRNGWDRHSPLGSGSYAETSTTLTKATTQWVHPHYYMEWRWESGIVWLIGLIWLITGSSLSNNRGQPTLGKLNMGEDLTKPGLTDLIVERVDWFEFIQEVLYDATQMCLTTIRPWHDYTNGDWGAMQTTKLVHENGCYWVANGGN